MNEASKLKVLVTNDDGIASEFMLKLARALSEICDVTVVVPDSQKSGISHAFTYGGLKLTKLETESFPTYTISGTPVDAVKFAVSERLCGGSVPDLVFSGINPGENSGISSIYSGTIGGAREGALWGIPSIALSLRGIKGDLLDTAIEFAKSVVEKRLFAGMEYFTFWNVNFPKANVPFKGFTVARMTTLMFTDHYDFQNGLYNLDGEKDFEGAPVGTDDRALGEGYAVITPLQVDCSAQKEFDRLSSKMNELSL